MIFWAQNEKQYPRLAKLAKKFLSAPATSVSSERMFSTSGAICSDKRSRLLPDNLEKLVYLCKNLKAVDFKY